MRPVALAAALSLAFGTPALAQTGATTAQPGIGGAGVPNRLQEGQIRANDLIDRDVRSSDDADIGEVEDLILDPAGGRIVAAIIEVEGTLGFGGRYVAVPLGNLRLDGNRRVTVAMTRDELRAMPAFEYRD
jgi:sporulation protein YlmC with PRC-barrel domain